MKKIVLLVFASVLLSISTLGSRLSITANGSTIHHVYPGQSIQEAINSAQPGDIIFVHNGTYYENVAVNQPVRLIGENKHMTIIDGGLSWNLHVVKITASNVVISNFTIRKSGPWLRSGIHVYFSNGNNITNNIITLNIIGIELDHSNNNRLIGNEVEYNGHGIWLLSSRDNVLRDNLMYANTHDNFGVFGVFTNDVDVSNKVDSKPIYYLINQHGKQIPLDAGYVALIDSTNMSIQNLKLKNNCQGILLVNSNNVLIQNVSMTYNAFGISLLNSSDNTLIGNTVTNNDDYGIYLSLSSNNLIYHNNFVDNSCQAHVKDYRVNIWDDGYPSGGNYWSDYTGADVENGPYQNETGSDGIGDVTYTVPSGELMIDFELNLDRYPLKDPINIFEVSTLNGVPNKIDVVSNSTVSGFRLDTMRKMISFNVTGPDYTPGFSRVTIPNIIIQDLWQGNYTVLLDGKELFMINNWTDGKYTCVYFTYVHSEHKVTIIPEFPTWTSMLFILIVLAVVITIYKKKTTQTPIY